MTIRSERVIFEYRMGPTEEVRCEAVDVNTMHEHVVLVVRSKSGQSRLSKQQLRDIIRGLEMIEGSLS